ncbi:MAG: glycine cleavage system aminomethyltransferase GcvT [Promethearchaeota archaeon]
MRIQLHNWHSKNAQMVSFAGFEMPILYSSIVDEHLTVRNAAGLFDVSHMGRLFISGTEACRFLDSVVPRDISKVPVGRAAYTFVLNEQAGFRDDLVISHLEEEKYLMVPNAGNREKIYSWLINLLQFMRNFHDIGVSVQDVSTQCAMFAFQGPKAAEIIKRIVSGEVPGRWAVNTAQIADCEVLLSRTGYTGEDGFEIIVFDTSLEIPSKGVKVWETILDEGKEEGVKPCGLGARDTLRLESGFCLYGNDIEENINPVEAKLFFPPFVHIDKEILFIGQEALKRASEGKPERVRVGFVTLKKGPTPRSHQEILKDDKIIGETTSGSFSPIIERGMGIAYIDASFSEVGTEILIRIRKKDVPAKIVEFPVYDPDMYGFRRK